MADGAFTTCRRPPDWLLYGEVALLVLITFVLGRAGVGLVRYGFIAGCIGLGIQSWKAGPARHFEMSLVLFVCAPFLRRVVDFSTGFDASGYMLVGPMLGLLPACAELYHWFVTGRLRGGTGMLTPVAAMSACLLYAATISLTNGAFVPLVVALIKYAIPMLYGLWLAARGGEEPHVVDGAARALLMVMPLAGCYALYQYFSLPEWDSYWMVMTAAVINSLGLPEAEKVRVFSTMNSAASFGHFSAAALILIGLRARTKLSLLLCLPVAAGLMLSLYRTAWIGLVMSLAYCWLYGATRRRAALVGMWMAAGAVLLLSTTSFGDTVLDRLSTFSSPGDDGSGQARLGEFSQLYVNADDLWLGFGLGGEVSGAGFAVEKAVSPSDGSIVDAALLMGLVAGGLYLVSLVWVSAQGLMRVPLASDARRVACGAVLIGNLVALPLTSVTKGEIGFLFWSFLGLLSAEYAGSASIRASLRASA